MLIVFTSEQEIKNEARILNQLFANGLTHLHLRKPFYSAQQCKELVTQIDESYHNRIMIHQFFTQATTFGLKGIHLKEANRLDKTEREKAFELAKQHQLAISTSFHQLTDLKQNINSYNYAFLSPVFNSISKQNYKAKQFNITGVKANVIALGGITEQHIQEAFNRQYKGVAVLGSIWQSDNPLTAFLTIKKQYKRVYHT